MNSPEASLANWISRRSMLKALSLFVLVPTVSSAVERVTARDSGKLQLKHKKKLEKKETEQSRESNAWKTALIVSALLWLDADVRNTICYAIDDFLEKYIINPLSQEYGDTMSGKVKMILVGMAWQTLASFFSVKSGNASHEHYVKGMEQRWEVSAFWDDILRSSIAAPLLEETLVRVALPFALKVNFNQEVAQYYSSLIFWFMHNLTWKGFDTATFPLPIIMDWFFYFYLKESRGLSHSIFAHSFHNTLAVIFDHAGRRWAQT